MASGTPGPVEREARARLEAALAPVKLTVTNESALHSGHAGDDGSGESHFAVEVVSEKLAGMSRVAIQRAVYDALGDLMQQIHALRIDAKAE